MRKALFVLFVVVLVLGVAQLVSANSDIGTAYSVNSSYVQVLEPGQQPGPGTLSTYHFSGLVYPYQDPNALDYFGVQKMAEFANKNQNDFYCYANSGSYQSPGGTLWLRYAQLLKIDPASEAGTVWGFVGKVISITQLNDCFRIKLEVTEPAAYSGVIIKYYIKDTLAEPANDGLLTMLQFALSNSAAYDVYINADLSPLTASIPEINRKILIRRLRYAQLLRADTTDIATVATGYVGKVQSVTSQNNGAEFEVELLITEPAAYANTTVTVILENNNGWVHCGREEMLTYARDNQNEFDVYINEGGYLGNGNQGYIQYTQLLRAD